MKHLIIYFLLFAYLSVYGHDYKNSKINTFKNFAEYCSALSDYDTRVAVPDSLVPIDMRARESFFDEMVFMPAVPRDTRYSFAFETPDGHAAYLFPDIRYDLWRKTLRNSQYIENELRAASRDLKLDVRPLLSIIEVDNMTEYSNADIAVVYSFDLAPNFKSFLNTYNHCIGIYLRKKGHPSMLLKIMLDDEGVKDSEKYITDLLSYIHYGDSETRLTRFEPQLTTPEFDFPSHKIGYTGIFPQVTDEVLDALIQYRNYRQQRTAEEDSLRISRLLQNRI